MIRKSRLPELLAPAGDFECLVAAVKGGADAIYLGAKAFGARAYAKNFDIEDIKRAVAYCHFRGVRVYVTLNTLILDSEMEEALSLAKELYLAGVDALIVCDLGLIRNIRKYIPDFELHASTQMSIHNSLGADEAYNLGCTRVVLARELSGRDIAEVTLKCKAETEVFLHGALCVCHSGQCLFSSLAGGRSGNRGECAQPCRLPYGNGGYPLSLKDLSLSAHMDELISSGVASLKIEGRMKSPDYVYTVTSIYRKLLDEKRNARKDEDELLRQAFTRGGFTDGYFVGEHKGKMTGVRSEEDKRASRELEGRVYSPEKISVKAKVVIKRDEQAKMTLDFKKESDRRAALPVLLNKTLTAVGSMPQEALNAPLQPEEVKARLAKMGNTLLSLSTEDIELSLDEGINMSPSLLNSLRRDAVGAFEGLWQRSLNQDCRFNASSDKPIDSKTGDSFFKTALCYEPAVYSEASRELEEYFDVVFLPLHRYEEAQRKSKGISVPPVVTESEISEVANMLRKAKALGAEYALCSNLGHIRLIADAGLKPVGDFRLNVYNKSCAMTVRELVGERYIASAELDGKGCGAVLGSAVVYGRIPLMLTERCFIRDCIGCKKCSDYSLKDRKGAEFPIIREHSHRNLLLNSAITYMGDKFDTLSHFNVTGMHFIFTKESASEIKKVIRAFTEKRPMPLTYPFRRMGRRDANKK